MEQIKSEQIRKTVDAQNFDSTTVKSSDLQSDVLSRTPAKANETLPSRDRREATELPQKWVLYMSLTTYFCVGT